MSQLILYIIIFIIIAAIRILNNIKVSNNHSSKKTQNNNKYNNEKKEYNDDDILKKLFENLEETKKIFPTTKTIKEHSTDNEITEIEEIKEEASEYNTINSKYAKYNDYNYAIEEANKPRVNISENISLTDTHPISVYNNRKKQLLNNLNIKNAIMYNAILEPKRLNYRFKRKN